MADGKRTLLRPEDARSWEEFQARGAIEQAQCRGSTGSWKTIGRTLLSSVLLPRADGTLRSSPSSRRSAVQKQEEINKCRRR